MCLLCDRWLLYRPCGNCSISCGPGPYFAICGAKGKEKNKKERRYPGIVPKLSSAPQEIAKKDPTVGPLPSTTEETRGLYEHKVKRSNDPDGKFYAEGGHVPAGTSPNRILPRRLLKRKDEYTCICNSIFGKCSVNCGVGGQNSTDGGKKKKRWVVDCLVRKRVKDDQKVCAD